MEDKEGMTLTTHPTDNQHCKPQYCKAAHPQPHIDMAAPPETEGKTCGLREGYMDRQIKGWLQKWMERLMEDR